MNQKTVVLMGIAMASLLSVPLFSQELGSVYPHSIIPGGVTSPEQYAREQGHPGVGFLRPQYLQHDLVAYVDFRDGSNIAWTGSRVTIRKGELVYGDKYGNLVRGRCGNDIAVERPPKAYTPPSKYDLDTPEVAWVTPPELLQELAQVLPFEFPDRWPEQPALPAYEVSPDQGEVLPPLAITPLPASFPIFPIFPVTPVIPGVNPPPAIPVGNVPEPAAIWLFLGAAVFFGARRLLSRKSAIAR